MEVMSEIGLLGLWPKQLVGNELENCAVTSLENGGPITFDDAKNGGGNFKIQLPLDQSVDMLGEEDFATWMDEKMDLEKIGLSLMDFEVPGSFLDDLLVMEGDGSELGPTIMDSCLSKPDSFDLPPLDSKLEGFSNVIKDEIYGSVVCTPPDSPSALVPEIPSPKPFGSSKRNCITSTPEVSLGLDSMNPIYVESPINNDLKNDVDVVDFTNVNWNTEDINFLYMVTPQNVEVTDELVLQGPDSSVSQAASVVSDKDANPSADSSLTTDRDKTDSESDSSTAPTKKRARRKQANGKSGRRGGVSEVTRRERKKSQNKDAATRYRYKKRAELQSLLDEEASLLGKNAELKENGQKLSNEISYLKKLLRELFKAKGLLK